jgi:hypothetical protein
MNKQVKAIFSDIDGTLLNSKHQISERTKAKIHEIGEKQIPFILVSARMPQGMIGFQQELHTKNPMICYSGALVIGGEGEVLYSVELKPETAKRIMKLTKEITPGVSINPYSYDRWMAEDKEEYWTHQEMEITGVIPEEVSFEDEKVWAHIHKILCMGNPEEIKYLEERLKEDYPEIQIYRSKDTYLEIMAKEASKSGAVHMLEQHFQIKKEETIGFGDGYNDIDMLKYVGTGIAMGNAFQVVKEAADYVTDTNDEEGLWKVLNALF